MKLLQWYKTYSSGKKFQLFVYYGAEVAKFYSVSKFDPPSGGGVAVTGHFWHIDWLAGLKVPWRLGLKGGLPPRCPDQEQATIQASRPGCSKGPLSRHHLTGWRGLRYRRTVSASPQLWIGWSSAACFWVGQWFLFLQYILWTPFAWIAACVWGLINAVFFFSFSRGCFCIGMFAQIHLPWLFFEQLSKILKFLHGGTTIKWFIAVEQMPPPPSPT